MMGNKCHLCKHYVLQYSHLLKTYVEGCDAGPNTKAKGCNGIYEKKENEPQKAYIK